MWWLIGPLVAAMVAVVAGLVAWARLMRLAETPVDDAPTNGEIDAALEFRRRCDLGEFPRR